VVGALAGYVAVGVHGAGAEPFSSGSPSSAFSNDQRAEELYTDGVEKLVAGHKAFARETFGSVIARYPSTDAARRAQQRLGELNGIGAAESDASRAPMAPGPVTGSLTVFSETMSVPEAKPRGPTWDRELRRNASIQSKLRIDAGDRVFFSAGSAELGSRARMALSAQAQWLMRWHEFEAAVEGHADEPGSEQENLVLSEQRALAVRDRLIAEGVEPGRLAIVSQGRSVRIATCADADCRAQNSRAVTLVFAGGTRERLGLITAHPLSAALSSPVPDAVVTPAAATTVQALGVTR
jgi:peptidoglycan-associated lipoprotein